jgi:peptidyl-prolyl cis-trans isomerase B (cyclophilin B)
MEPQMNADQHRYKKGFGQVSKIEEKSFNHSLPSLLLSPFLLIRVHLRSSVVNLVLRCVSLLVCGLAFAIVSFGQETSPAQKSNSEPPKKSNQRPVTQPTPAPEPFDGATVEKLAAQCVRLETEAGVIEIEMLAESAPETARNFLNLVATGAFDTTTFSRVVKGFVIQGGNLSTRLTLTPELAERSSRTIVDEPSNIKHVRGIVSMALPSKPNSATTHFFILVGAAPHLDEKFSAFGRVVSGMDVVDAINQAPTDGEKPEKPVRVTRAAVIVCPARKEEDAEEASR